MVYNQKGQVLVQDRKKEDWKGIAFPGGKVESNESIIESTIREIKEETGLTITNLQGCGYKDWEREGVRRIVFLFKTNQFEGELIEEHREGKNFWIEIDKIKEYQVAKGFLGNLPMFLEDKYAEMYLRKNLEGEWDKILK